LPLFSLIRNGLRDGALVYGRMAAEVFEQAELRAPALSARPLQSSLAQRRLN
jgi:hypothetical protein